MEDLRPPDALEAAEALPAGLPRFFSVGDFLPLSTPLSVCFLPLPVVELLARGVLAFGVRLAGELFFEDRPPLDYV